MTNPFEPFSSKPTPVPAEIVAESGARDFGAIDFPAFSFDEIPSIEQRHRAPRTVTDPQLQEYALPIFDFEPGNAQHYKVFGFVGTNDPKIDDTTEKLFAKVANHLRKAKLRIIRRTVVLPSDAHLPAHQQRKVLVVWRNTNAD